MPTSLVQKGQSVFHVTLDGTVICWGGNEYGQLGLGHKSNIPTPTQIPNLTNIKKVFCTHINTFFLDGDGQVFFCGYEFATCTIINTPTKLNIPVKIKHIIESKLGDTFLIDENDDLWGCGINDKGQLGLGHQNPIKTPVKIPVPAKVSSAFLLWRASYVIDQNGNVWGFGSNYNNKLGLEKESNILKPTKFPNLKDIQQVSSDSLYVFYLDKSGDVWIGGGQFESPINWIIGYKIKEIMSGELCTFMLDENGRVWSHGYNSNGILGLETKKYFDLPIQLATLPKIIKIFADGYQNTFFIDVENNVWACGRNRDGELGVGHNKPVLVPTKLPLQNVCQVTQATWSNNLFVHLDGRISGCGNNNSGELGLGHTGPVSTPTFLKFQIELGNGPTLTPAQIKSEQDYIEFNSPAFEKFEKKILAIINRFEEKVSFFTIGMGNKAKEIHTALTNLKNYLAQQGSGKKFSMKDLLTYKPDNDAKNLVEALNINRLPIYKEETNSLREMRSFKI